MWVLHPVGFFSAVQHREHPDMLIVRCRVEEDMQALSELHSGLVTFTDYTADYPFRAIVAKAEWKAILADLTDEITYANFKDEVTRRQGKKRHDVYLRVWGILRGLESRKTARERGKMYSERGLWPDDDRDIPF